MCYFEIFKREIIAHSVSKTYYEACNEWEAISYDIADDDDDYYCICSHPIKQLIYIRNINNGNEVIVGSDCIQKIEGIPYSELYVKALTNLQEMRLDNDATIGKHLIDFISKKKLLDDKHIVFLRNMRCKRYLTVKQELYYSGLVKKLLKTLGAKSVFV